MVARSRCASICCGLAALICSWTRVAQATVTEVGSQDDWRSALDALQAGDELVLQGGTYTLTARFGITLSGTEQAPIIVRAKAGEIPVFRRPDANQNLMDVENSQYLVLRGLEIFGGSHGVRLIESSFITIENCNVHDTADVGISANSGGHYRGLQILHNEVHDTGGTGEGMYLGCNENACRISDSLIAGNHVHHTNGPTVEQGDGIEIKEGSYNNVVRDNVIHDTNYPCILTYSTVGNGAPNIIERNLLWHCGDHGIQAADDAIIQNNIILSSVAASIRTGPHQNGVPTNVVIVHNTILQNEGDAIRGDGLVGSLVIANNAIYAPNGSAIRVQGALTGLVTLGNMGVGDVQGITDGFTVTGGLASDLVAASFSGEVPNDVFPKVGSPLLAGGDAAYLVLDDFNGTAREGAADVGAYKFDATGNPGWGLGPDFKDDLPGGLLPPVVAAGGSSGSGSGGLAGTGSAGRAGAGPGPGSGGTDASAGGGPAPASGSDAGCACRSARPTGSGRRGLAWFGLLGAALLRQRRPRGR